MRRRSWLLGTVAAGALLGTTTWSLYRNTGTALARKLEGDFRQFVGPQDLMALGPEHAFTQLSSFARTVKYPHEPGPYGDSLLFEYGIYNWGKGENFEFSLTRHVVFPIGDPQEADDKIIQLRLSFLYPPDDFRNLSTMTMWEENLERGMSMSQFIRTSPAFALAMARPPRGMELFASPQ